MHHSDYTVYKVANPVLCDQLDMDRENEEKKNFPCPFSRLRIWSREMGLAVPSRVRLVILHTQTESGAYSRDSS